MPYVTHRGYRTHYVLQGKGPLVILVHGLFGSAETWLDNGFVEGLAPDYTVASVDALAHGRSDAPSDPAAYALDDRAGELVAIMDALGAPKAHVLGYSMGGWISSGLARRYPDRLASLVVAGWDLVHGVETAAADAKEKWGMEDTSLDGMLAMMRRMAPESVAWVTPRFEAALRASVQRPQDLDRCAGSVAALQVPVMLWNGIDDPYHDPMKAFAEAHGLRFLSTSGNHLTAFRLYADDALAGYRRFLAEGTESRH